MRQQECQVHPYTWDINNFHIGNFNGIHKTSVTSSGRSGPPGNHQVRKLYAILCLSQKSVNLISFELNFDQKPKIL